MKNKTQGDDSAETLKEILSGNRRALAKTLTLMESTKEEHIVEAQKLLKELLPYTGKSFRLGISGPPGVGKSTFINGFASYLIQKNKKKVAVLAVDPSSPVSGGSLLADKTRMEDLSQLPEAFIRPSPSSGVLGGVANKTRECMLVCEAAGFDFIIIETVGVGQSEFEVVHMVDHLMTLMQPHSGDELQGIKKGLLEISHSLVVNKWDGEYKNLAEKTSNQLKSALGITLQEDKWKTPVLLASAEGKLGFEEIYSMLNNFSEIQRKSQTWENIRKNQNWSWFQKLLQQFLLNQVKINHSQDWKNLEAKISESQITPFEGLQQIQKLLAAK